MKLIRCRILHLETNQKKKLKNRDVQTSSVSLNQGVVLFFYRSLLYVNEDIKIKLQRRESRN